LTRLREEQISLTAIVRLPQLAYEKHFRSWYLIGMSTSRWVRYLVHLSQARKTGMGCNGVQSLHCLSRVSVPTTLACFLLLVSSWNHYWCWLTALLPLDVTDGHQETRYTKTINGTYMKTEEALAGQNYTANWRLSLLLRTAKTKPTSQYDDGEGEPGSSRCTNSNQLT